MSKDHIDMLVCCRNAAVVYVTARNEGLMSLNLNTNNQYIFYIFWSVFCNLHCSTSQCICRFYSQHTILLADSRISQNLFKTRSFFFKIFIKQGKSEGFEGCDRPIIRKRPIWVKIGDVLSRVTLKFDGWPWKTIGHLSFAVSSFVQHFIAIGEFKLELLSGNAQFGSNSLIFRAVWPWNLTYDLEKQ